MAIDPSGPTRTEPDFGVSAIENEIPAYRAIHATALVSLGLGVVSFLCFADLSFLPVAVAAIASGVFADWTIRRRSDVLTGRGFAQAGIVLGLVCGLGSLTHDQVDRFLLSRKIDRFADQFIEILEHDGVADAMWYREHPDARAGKTPKQVEENYQAASRGVLGNHMAEAGQIQAIKDRLAGGGHLRRVEIETFGYDRLTPYGAVVIEFVGGSPPKDPEATEDVLLELKGEKKGSDVKWWISAVQIPYQRKTYHFRPRVVDDGHGHSHSH